jgi:hypothetical protein
MTTSPFTDVLHEEVAVLQARHPILAGVLGRAHALVADGHVFPEPDGTSAMVQSSEGMRWYHVNGSCPCDASHYQDGPCKHRLAVRLYQRVCERLAEDLEGWAPVPEPAQEPGHQAAQESGQQPLPEAPVSITLKAMLHGHEVLVTLRGTDFASVREQVEAASTWLRSQTPAPAVDVPQCPMHHVAMKENHKDGRTWWSHKTAQGWCKGR